MLVIFWVQAKQSKATARALISASLWVVWTNPPGVPLTRGTVGLPSLKLIVAPVSLTERLDSQLMLMRGSDHCPWMIATALSVLEEGEWNRASHQHETGAIRMARIYRHVTGMPWLLENEIDHVTAELKSNKTWHVREPCTMHVTREHQ